jgi:hypothetical protein
MPLGKDLSTHRTGGSMGTWSSLDRPRKELSLSSAGNVSECSLYEYTYGVYCITAAATTSNCLCLLSCNCVNSSQVQTFRKQGSQAAWCNGYALLVFRRCPFRIPARTPDIRNFNVVFHIQAEKFRASNFISPRELLHNFSIYHTNIILVFYVIYSLMYWQLRKIKH